MTELRADFYFTQARLQDYLDCNRRFQLRYLLEQPWPAHVMEPADKFEMHMEQGRRFHQLVQRYILGMPTDALQNYAAAPPLSKWWQDFLAYGLQGLPALRFAEVTRSSSLEGFRLVGKFDLIAIEEGGSVVIVDWKTSKFIPGISELRQSMQSRLYPYILAREGLEKYGYEKIVPDQIRMRYWYAQDPQSPKEFMYGKGQFSADEQFLAGLIREIMDMDAENFPLTDDIHKCEFCLYRSLCDRGIEAGSISELSRDMDELEDWPGVVDLDEIQEIEF